MLRFVGGQRRLDLCGNCCFAVVLISNVTVASARDVGSSRGPLGASRRLVFLLCDSVLVSVVFFGTLPNL